MAKAFWKNCFSQRGLGGRDGRSLFNIEQKRYGSTLPRGVVAYYYLLHLFLPYTSPNGHNMPARSRGWCFTIHYADDRIDEILLHLQLLADDNSVSYVVVGREVCPTTGSKHLQGYVNFVAATTFGNVRELLPQSHIERARGSPEQNRTYCVKDGDFEEWGTLPDSPGRRTDWDRYKDWLSGLDRVPTERELIEHNPALWGRYRAAMREMAAELVPRVQLREGELRQWQSSLLEELDGEADDRTITFVVDPQGGAGKSWFAGYVYGKRSDSQLLGPGRRDDVAHVVDVRRRVFLVNVPRGQMEYLNYGLLESLKDRIVFSPKYNSQMKILDHVPHVVVFSNEGPDQSKMSGDRYRLIELS